MMPVGPEEGYITLSKVARDLDLTESAFRGWVEQARADRGKGKPGMLTSEERDELRHLRKEVRETAAGTGDTKKSRMSAERLAVQRRAAKPTVRCNGWFGSIPRLDVRTL
jgi:transposase